MTFVRGESRHGLDIVTLDRPDRLNALGSEMVDGLSEAFAALEADGSTLVVLAAEGRHFCAGGDFGAMDRPIALGAYRDMEPFHRLVKTLARRRALLIAAV